MVRILRMQTPLNRCSDNWHITKFQNKLSTLEKLILKIWDLPIIRAVIKRRLHLTDVLFFSENTPFKGERQRKCIFLTDVKISTRLTYFYSDWRLSYVSQVLHPQFNTTEDPSCMQNQKLKSFHHFLPRMMHPKKCKIMKFACLN